MLKDIAESYDLILVRLWLLSAHYRSPINFSRAVMEATKNGYERLMNGKHNLERLLAHAVDTEPTEAETHLLSAVHAQEEAFTKALADDLNTADALSAIYEIVRMANSVLHEGSAKKTVEQVYQKLIALLDVLGIADHSAENDVDEEVERLITEREEARKAKDFAKADAIRDALAQKGILLKDTRTGVTWTRK